MPETPSQAPPIQGPGHLGLLVQAVLLLLPGLLTWAPTLHGGTVPMDTQWLVVDNPLLGPGDLAVLPSILWDMSASTRWQLGAEFLPIRDLSVLLDFALFGPSWGWHHATSLALYLLGCLLAWALLRKLLGVGLRAWVAALLFCTLPVHAENVAWLAGRKDLLGLVFSIAAVLLALSARPLVGIVGSALLVLLAIWSKNTAFIVPLWIFSALWFRDRERWRGRWLWAAVVHGAVLATCFTISLALGDRVGLLAEQRFEGPTEFVVLQGRMLLDYALLLLAPWRLCLFHPPPQLHPPLQLLNLAGLAVAGVLVGGLLASWRRAPLLALGLFWFAAALIPTSQLVPLQNVIAERYLLLPSLGLVLALAAALPGRRGWSLGLLAAALFGAGFAFQRAGLWSDPVELIEDVVQTHPGDPKHEALLLQLRMEREPAQALPLAREAVAAWPDIPALQRHLGHALLQAGLPAEAVQAYRRALRGDANDMEAGKGMIAAQLATGDAAGALASARALSQRFPDQPGLWSSRGVAALHSERLDEARDSLDTALQLDADHVEATCNRAGVAWLQRDRERAEAGWQRCLELEPDHRKARRGLQALQASP